MSNSLSESNDINLLSFMSGINFIETLCNICERTKEIPNEQQLGFIRREITEINKTLPANIYIPFLKDSIRNYIICHIPVTELKIFRTKNRAPYMLTIEVIRIDEVIQYLLNKEKSTQKKYDLNYKEVDDEEEIDKLRCHSMTFSNLTGKQKFKFNNKVEINKKKSEGNDDHNFTTFVKTQKEMNRKRSNTMMMMMLAESDIKLSKPLIISNLETEIKRTPLRGEKKIILEENEEHEESFVKENMEDIVKRRLTMYPMKKNKVQSKDNNLSLFDEKIFKKKDQNFSCDSEFVSRARNYTTCEMRPEGKFTLNLEKENTSEDNIYANDFSQNIQINISQDHSERGQSISKNETHSEFNDKKYENMFGETIEEQSARIKKFSPFGRFKTWQIFKMISNIFH